jgi:outer membrane protein
MFRFVHGEGLGVHCRQGRRPVGPVLPLCAALALAACNDTRDLAPASPSMPWHTEVQATEPAAPDAVPVRVFALPRQEALPYPAQNPAEIDPAHPYTLPELIDLAQTRNQGTRVAWEQARQAAIAVGISQSTLLPELTIDALGGYSHQALPFPKTLAPRGYITTDSEAVFPELVLKYLLIDFGGRRAGIERAKQLSYASNVAFTAAHQALIKEVAQAYFQLDGLNAQLASARMALSNAKLVQAAADSKLARGEGTVTDQAIARRGVAQAALAIPQAETAQRAARLTLLALLDLPPQTTLAVQDSSARPLTRGTLPTLGTLMADALRQRPDLQADLARLRASEESVAVARSDLWPTLSVASNLQGNIGQLRTDNGPYGSVRQPQWGALLRFDWPLYQGGARENRVRLAQSKQAEAEDDLRKESTEAMREVALAYDVLTTGLAQYDAAVTYRAAADTAFQAASSAYAHRVGTLTDAANAQTALAAAQAFVAQAHAQALVNAASLAFAAGGLTSAASPAVTEARP